MASTIENYLSFVNNKIVLLYCCVVTLFYMIPAQLSNQSN